MKEKTVLAGWLAVITVGLLAPSASYAQGDQKIVMRCTFDGYTDQTLDYALDLAAKTISLTHTTNANAYMPSSVIHYSGTITQVADDRISWVYSHDDRSVTDTLNRYTGQIVEQVVSPTAGNFTLTISCKRQQKEF